MATAGNPVIIGIPVPFTAVQAQAEAKLLPGGGFSDPWLLLLQLNTMS